jgi:hypothetical protein
MVLGMHHPIAGATRRCPMQPSTPLGPDQVNVLLFAASEAKKIPLKHMGCPICEEEGIPFHGSSPRTFQDHRKRKHNVEFTRSVDPVVLTMSQIIGQDIALMINTATEGGKIMRMPVPVCYHPNCKTTTSDIRSVKRHIEVEHKTRFPDLGIWDLFVAHIRNKQESDTTIQDLLGKHEVRTCTKCAFTATTAGWVKRHLHRRKSGNASEVAGTMYAAIVPGIRGDGHDERKKKEGLSQRIFQWLDRR